MPLLPVTALYASVLGLFMLHLAYQVTKYRQLHRAGLGHSNHDVLIAGRNHANATEYIPITLILLALGELNGAANGVLHLIGVTFVFARILHAWGFKVSKGGAHPARYWGIVLSFLCMITLALLNLYLSWPYIL